MFPRETQPDFSDMQACLRAIAAISNRFLAGEQPFGK
jgi:hypothetical protein